ncbi:DUF6789 family protein [Halomarina ordinaria]|uniref:DUF6789 family protein n=1 Tax=Halomarina ordinaria TaxID=3033939 RepID=A0ABD5U7I2_9EURY|nr:DUF6789 family protein [Halomarina sp. PSRA2]
MSTDESDTKTVADPTDPADSLKGVIVDGVVGAAGGFVGTALMTVVLLIAQGLGAFETASFADLARLIALQDVLGEGPLQAAGYLIFLAGGMTTWPLLFASVEAYLPGGTMAQRGISFGTVLWTGFVIAFYAGQTGTALYLYVALTLVAHWVYGFGLGLVFTYFSTRPDTLV